MILVAAILQYFFLKKTFPQYFRIKCLKYILLYLYIYIEVVFVRRLIQTKNLNKAVVITSMR